MSERLCDLGEDLKGVRRDVSAVAPAGGARPARYADALAAAAGAGAGRDREIAS
ncbi:hypothetical protein [Streptomyces sp. RTd22]|uniref:hypothetical protein n=1 Tax=Streptomyces sp. RTd22 TaxID=1841249 RepID=UPI000A823900|nr:hypothetical protein [Streptomyces sp. RTd22]